MIKTIVTLLIILLLGAAPCASAKKESPHQLVKLNVSNTLIFDSEITPISVHTFISAVVGKRVAVPPEQTVYIILFSGGGNYVESVRLANFLNSMPNIAVICKYCASGAAMVFATSVNPRFAIKKSNLLMHEMYREKVTAALMDSPGFIQSLKASSDEFNKIMYTVLGMSKEKYEEKILNKEWTVKGEELVKLKLADRVIRLECDSWITSMAPDTCSE